MKHTSLLILVITTLALFSYVSPSERFLQNDDNASLVANNDSSSDSALFSNASNNRNQAPLNISGNASGQPHHNRPKHPRRPHGDHPPGHNNANHSQNSSQGPPANDNASNPPPAPPANQNVDNSASRLLQRNDTERHRIFPRRRNGNFSHHHGPNNASFNSGSPPPVPQDRNDNFNASNPPSAPPANQSADSNASRLLQGNNTGAPGNRGSHHHGNRNSSHAIRPRGPPSMNELGRFRGNHSRFGEDNGEHAFHHGNAEGVLNHWNANGTRLL